MMNCVQCQTDTKKYKCSKCLQYCCSFDCYKSHKSSELCLAAETKLETTADVPIENEPKTLPQFSSEDTIEPMKLAELATSNSLKQLLHNKHLRQFLTEIDTAPNAWKAMQIAMMEPLFIEFADECLKIVDTKT